jgi:hypothetical protein
MKRGVGAGWFAPAYHSSIKKPSFEIKSILLYSQKNKNK